MLLDEGVFEDEGVLFGPGGDGFEVVRLAHEQPHLGGEVARGLEIGPHPLPQRGGLAHVQDDAVRPAEQVHARGVGEPPGLGSQFGTGHRGIILGRAYMVGGCAPRQRRPRFGAIRSTRRNSAVATSTIAAPEEIPA